MPLEGFSALDVANRWGRQWADEPRSAVHPETCAAPAVRHRHLSPKSYRSDSLVLGGRIARVSNFEPRL